MYLVLCNDEFKHFEYLKYNSITDCTFTTFTCKKKKYLNNLVKNIDICSKAISISIIS